MSSNDKPSIKLISERTGYSFSSVSRVLNGLGDRYRISKKAQAEILKYAQELNFTPNQIARGLRLKKTDTIGLIVPNIANPFFAEIAKIITRKARVLKQSILLLDSEDALETENQCLQTLLARQIDGIILFPSTSHNILVDQARESGVPVLLVDRYYESSEIPYISSNNFQGAVLATQHLVDHDHSFIACIQGNPESSPNSERVKGFLNCIEENNIPLSHVTVLGDEFSEENGYSSTLAIIDHRSTRPVTAIFALSNLIAIGAIRAIREAGLRIPEDISLITFDDQEMLSMITPAITAIDQPKKEIGENALEMILKLIRHQEISQQQIQLETTLIQRDSVRKNNL